jgi:hypothetical protein
MLPDRLAHVGGIRSVAGCVKRPLASRTGKIEGGRRLGFAASVAPFANLFGHSNMS